MIRWDGWNEIVEKTEQVKARFVDIENEIDQFRFDGAMIGIDQFLEVESYRALITDRIQGTNEIGDLRTQTIDMFLFEEHS